MSASKAVRSCFVSLLLLLVGAHFAIAQPFTRRSSQVQHDGLKKYYEIANFRLGGKYDLSDPSKWENGGEGGATLVELETVPPQMLQDALNVAYEAAMKKKK